MTLESSCQYSTIKPSELMAHVLPQYRIDKPIECLFWERGSNDTYKVRCTDAQYFLRVFRHGAYSKAANEFEAEALIYLYRQGVPVAYPMPRKSGGYIAEIVAPEGPRFVLLTSVANGSTPDYESLKNCRLVGESIARLHTLSTGFESTYERTHLDLKGLLDDSMDVIRQYFPHQPSAINKIERIAQAVKATVQAVPDELLDYGICHGDLHGGNLHIHEDLVTLFDFEECAFGYRAYDLGTFKWNLGSNKQSKEKWSAFIEGYSSIRPLTESAHAVIDTFVIIRELVEAAYGIRHVEYFGHNDILAADIDQLCDRLHKMQALVS
jgi:Ser/Thr protein kinase RdoA (MazF antagonist)